MMTLQQLQSNLRKTIPRGRLRQSQPGFCPALSLYLYDPEALEGPLDHDCAQAIVAEPAYWSFCWASGQVLAQYILDHPEWVRDKTVLDIGTGSGIVAIAAARAGAQRVIACDIDPHALHAAQANAELNGVALEYLSDWSAINTPIDLLTAADVLYDRDNLPLLEAFPGLASHILLADSRVRQLPVSYLQEVFHRTARTWPDLNEFEEFNQVRLYASTARPAP